MSIKSASSRCRFCGASLRAESRNVINRMLEIHMARHFPLLFGRRSQGD